MGIVLDAFASYVSDLLKQLVEDKVGMQLGVTDDINNMAAKLGDLKKILADADRRNITDESVQGWVAELRRAMYEATDILDLCRLKAMESGESTVKVGYLRPIVSFVQNSFHALDIGNRIKALNQKLDIVKERSATFNFIRSYEDHNTNVNPSRETSGELDRSGVVGEQIEEDTRALVAEILQARNEVNNRTMVVAIVGVGGIGKTTLAQKVFNDEAIQDEFENRMWLSVNKNFSVVELLRRAIIEAKEDPNTSGNAKATLQRTLSCALTNRKTLLVMDDVWSHGAWEDVLKIPFVNAAASGSRVLITTRDKGVARGMKATLPYHQVGKLASSAAWSLLKNQVLSSEIDEDQLNKLQDIGLKIIEKCGGLPLAVKVMGGLLRKRGGLRRDWMQVLDESKWSITQMPRELNYAVYLSYEDMPPYLKQCFLHYSLLPKSASFNVFQVVSMWISEGFIHGKSDDLEELGRNYYKELICRNLIEPYVNQYVEQWFCNMHDVVRSFAHYMVRDESMVAHSGEIDAVTKSNSQKLLRLFIETNQLQSDELDWKSLRRQQSLRTLISTIEIKMNPGDSLVSFSSLRTLQIKSGDLTLFESLHQLKHLRYLAVDSGISALPSDIGKMKLLQFLDICSCKKLENLPDSIVKLGQLRYLNLSNVSMIPREFRQLTNMRILGGFPAHMDGDWCSLDELGPLSQLRLLRLVRLENVSTASSAANVRLREKMHIVDLLLSCTSRLGHDGLVQENEWVSEEDQRQIEKVFNELCPPSSIEYLHIDGYFGQQPPAWMMSTSMVPLDNLKYLLLFDLASCTQLPNGLGQLPSLHFVQVLRAPYIRRVGTEFLHPSRAVETSFPRLHTMKLVGMLEWEEWEWEKQVQAMPRLEELLLLNCKLRCVPPGLAFNARALKVLGIRHVKHISYLENFPSVVYLSVRGSPDLERISNLPNLQKLIISDCPKLKVLEGVNVLQRLFLEDYTMEKLPEYIRDIKPRHLQLFCRLWLLALLATGQSGLEWDKFSHIEHVKAYAHGCNNQWRKWHVLYTRKNCKLESNISGSAVSEGTLSSSMVDSQEFESVYKMGRSTFNYVCSLVRVPLLEEMMLSGDTSANGRVLSLYDRVAIAIRMLNSTESLETIVSSLGVTESTVLLVTKSFVDAMWERAVDQPLHWPVCSKMEKIKCKFDKIHGLPNCCGVLHTTHITFGTQNHEHEMSTSVLMQALCDADMRFTVIWLGHPDRMNQLSLLHDSPLFKVSEKGAFLNGSNLEVSSEEVGEYIIGDAGYPLLPWLLTPYQLQNDILDIPPYQAEFNTRHSAARAVMFRAIARLKDTWKCLDGGTWCLQNHSLSSMVIYICCTLHNIVIDMEKDAGTPSEPEVNESNEVRQIADEDAVKARDVLSQHLLSARHRNLVRRKRKLFDSRGANKRKKTHHDE